MAFGSPSPALKTSKGGFGCTDDRWVLFDRQFDDVHVVGAVVGPEGIESFEAELNQLLKNVVWVAAE